MKRTIMNLDAKQDLQGWNKRKLAQALELLDQVIGKRLDGTDPDLERMIINIQDRAGKLAKRTEGDRRTKQQHYRDAANASADKPDLNPVADQKPFRGACERCPYPETCSYRQRCVLDKVRHGKPRTGSTI
jgi:hypothetical protein